MAIARDRRRFLRVAGAGAAAWVLPRGSYGASADGPDYRRLLVLVELQGGNDGLNTLVPFADPAYPALRPKLALGRDAAIRLDDRFALHPSLAALMPIWEAGEMAAIHGVGYPSPNLSHFRSIEIWNTASRSEDTLQQGWLARTFAAAPAPRAFAADGVVVGGSDLGPLAGGGARVIALTDVSEFLRRARLAHVQPDTPNRALAHLLRVESDIAHAAAVLDHGPALRTSFPDGAFGNAVRAAARAIAAGTVAAKDARTVAAKDADGASPRPMPPGAGIAAVKLALGSFDTHANQAATHANLLGQLAAGLSALRSALVELGLWGDTLVVTYSEFGRRARENQSEGTDHGTASVQFAFGGRVRGGLLGEAPDLERLDREGNPQHTTDFRRVYATVLERWWGLPAERVLGGNFAPLEFLRA